MLTLRKDELKMRAKNVANKADRVNFKAP